jgi:hypothetical protein
MRSNRILDHRSQASLSMSYEHSPPLLRRGRGRSIVNNPSVDCSNFDQPSRGNNPFLSEEPPPLREVQRRTQE